MVENNLDIKDLILYLWEKKSLIILVTMIFAVFGVLKVWNANNGLSNNDIYVSQVKFVVGNTEKKINIEQSATSVQDDLEYQNRKEWVSTTVTEEKVRTYEDILKSHDVLSDVIDELSLKLTVSELEKSISLEKDINSYTLMLDVKSDNKEEALKLSKHLTEKLEEKLNDVYKIENISIIDSPRVLNSNESSSIETLSISNLIKKALKYGIVGFVLVCGVIVILEIFNTSVIDEKQLESVTKLKNLSKLRNSRYNDDDRFKLLRVNLDGCKTILITSPENKDGKTYVATNLAKAFAKQNKKVVLIDLVKNENELIKKPTGKGLTDYLQSNDKFIEKCVLDTSINNLGILPLGKEVDTITELLESPKMQESLETLERLYDIIIIDSRNVLESANTLAVTKISKYTILVSAQRKTKLENIIKAKNNIEDIGGNVVGTVLTNSKK